MPHQSQFAARLKCLHCQKNVPASSWPLNGDAVPFYLEEIPGAYSVTIECPGCGESSFVVWDDDPGPVERLGAKESGSARSGGKPLHPQIYLVIKHTVQQAMNGGLDDFDELVRQAEVSLAGQYDMQDLLPLFRKAWNELHQ